MSGETDGPAPPRTASAPEVLRVAAEALARGRAAVLVTVLSRRGSAPATPGQKLVLTDDGACVGTVGGGALEWAILRRLPEALAAARRGEATPATASFNLGAGLGMCCGGGVEVLIEPMAAARAVGIVGAGHVAAAVAPLLARLGFVVSVVDEREEWAEEGRFPGASRVLCATHAELAKHLPREAAVLVMTHDHALDQQAIEWALGEGFAFVGGVGSRAKLLRTRARLEARGFAPAAVERVRMPLGLAIGARLPDEIAVAIAGEMVAWRRGIALPAEAVAPARAVKSSAAAEGDEG